MTTYNPAALPELVALLEEIERIAQDSRYSEDVDREIKNQEERRCAALALARQPVSRDQYTAGLELAAQGMSEIVTALAQETEQAQQRIAEIERQVSRLRALGEELIGKYAELAHEKRESYGRFDAPKAIADLNEELDAYRTRLQS